ncbi:MAG: SCP2 sterol-binding domain-containing protein [Paracoccaceae bacterium]
MIRLPPPPLAATVLSRLMAATLARHPDILRRMGPEAGKRILIDTTDLPALILIEPGAGRVTLHRRPPPHDAAIRGKLAAFLSMLHGLEDGDALFFSGALEISGDTAAVVALRNALDDAEIDLAAEIAALTHLPPPALHRVAATLGPRLGLSLHRSP